MMYEEDDFFYYLKIAEQLAHGHGSTFNTLVFTNGYHPLWLALLTLVARVSSSPHAAPVFLALAIFSSSAATYFLGRAILARHIDNPLLTNTLAGSLAIYAAHVYNGGMEIILTIPLMLALVIAYQERQVWRPRVMPAFLFGLLISALCLSRLDTMLVVLLLAMATLMHPRLRTEVGVKQVAGVCLGFVPVLLYLLSNHFLFGTWLPVSGMAKQLKSNHLPTGPAWHSLLSSSQTVHLLIVLAATALFPLVYKRLTPTQQAIYPILLIFPFFYVFVLSCLSDWELWPWYFYSLRIAICISFAVFLEFDATVRLLSRPWVVILLALLVFSQAIRNRRSTGFGPVVYPPAVDVRDFALTHPGIYAMGDRAGMVGYLLPDPLVQTEGLVMDRAFLSLIRNRTPLKEVFARYHVRYYIATENDNRSASCFHAVEPMQAGPDSPHMESTICQSPVAAFAYLGRQTVIFDLEQDGDPSTHQSLLR